MSYQGSISDNNDITEEDCVTIFVAYNGHWRYEGKEWFFENSKSSIMVVSKRITLSEISDILKEQLSVNKNLDRLKLEVHYRTGSPWFPITEIQNDHDLSVFISETSKLKLPLCVTVLRYKDEIRSAVDEISIDVDEERQKVFVAYNGAWVYDGKKWFCKNSTSSTIFVNKNITLREIEGILYENLGVDKKLYHLNLSVHYRTGSPWFPVTQIRNNQELSMFISETSKTALPLCVTRLVDWHAYAKVDGERRKGDTVENKLVEAIRKDDWVKAREIINTKEITWICKLDDQGNTAFHFAVGEFKNNEVVRDIINALPSNCELLETIVNDDGIIPAHTAAYFGNTEALRIMLDFNPKCLFIPDYNDDLPINYGFATLGIETLKYLIKVMQSCKDEFNKLLRGEYGLAFLRQVIDRGLIDVAYELINDYPSMATQVYVDEKAETPLEWIIRKPDLFYSGTHYNFYQRFIYRHIENNGLGGIDTGVVKNKETPQRRCLHDVISRMWVKVWKTILLHVPHVKQLKNDKVKHDTTIKLLRRVCKEVYTTHTSSDITRLYSTPFFLAVENNTAEAIDVLTTYFTELYASVKDGHNVYQLTVLNRSEKVYIFLMNNTSDAKTDFSIYKDDDGNNILHFAGRLAPIHKLNAASGAALQMQKELKWFEEVKKVVGITHTGALNNNKETPIMVFRREHEKLRKHGEEWMKKTADSYTITAAIIITIVFAAAITVPGGNDNATGKPIYETKASLMIFAISDAISLFTSTTSLLLFLSILTARYADEDFLYKLPKGLIFGLVMLFVSVTSMMITFSAALYIMFGQEKQWILIPIGALACLPIASFMTLQFPLLQELISSTYGPGIFAKEKEYWKSSAYANKKKRTLKHGFH